MKKVLFSKRRAIGDTLLMLPAIEYFHKKYPETEISVLVPAAAAPLFEEISFIQNIYRFEERNFLSLVLFLRSLKLDLILDLNCTGRTKWLFKFADAKDYFSHRHDLETEANYEPRPNAISWDFWALADYSTEFPKPNSDPQILHSKPQIQVTKAEIESAAHFWKARGAEPGKIVVLGLGASRNSKRWPAEHFARFAQLVRDRLEMTVALLVGPAPGEEAFATEILNRMRIVGFKRQNKASDTGGVIFQGNMPIRRYAALLSTAYAYVGNDSGPKHLAVSVGTPTLTFFGPEDPVEWHPYTSEKDRFMFLPELSCRSEDNGRWCSVDDCIIEKHRCMQDIDPDEAFKKFQVDFISSVKNGADKKEASQVNYEAK